MHDIGHDYELLWIEIQLSNTLSSLHQTSHIIHDISLSEMKDFGSFK